MRELLRSNDLVHLSWAQAALAAAGIERAARRPHQQRRRQHRGVSPPPDGPRRPPGARQEGARPGRASAREWLTPHRRSSAGRPRPLQPADPRLSRCDRSGAARRRRAGAAGRARAGRGAGTGAASLCPAARIPQCRIVGLELQRPLQRIASQNVTQNELDGQVEMIEGDLQRPPPRLAAATFDHVMTNRPISRQPAPAPRRIGSVRSPIRRPSWNWPVGWRVACAC